MNKRTLTIVTVLTIAFYVAVLVGWHLYVPHSDLKESLPGADNRPAGLARKADEVKVGEFFMKYSAAAPEGMNGIWSEFRGAERNNIVKATEAIQTTSDYPELWSFDTGEGHAAPVVYQGRVYVLDYDETLLSDMLRCFSLQSGEELWRRWYRVPLKRNHGFSRTIPAVANGRVVSIGPSGHVMC